MPKENRLKKGIDESYQTIHNTTSLKFDNGRGERKTHNERTSCVFYHMAYRIKSQFSAAASQEYP